MIDPLVCCAEDLVPKLLGSALVEPILDATDKERKEAEAAEAARVAAQKQARLARSAEAKAAHIARNAGKKKGKAAGTRQAAGLGQAAGTVGGDAQSQECVGTAGSPDLTDSRQP